MTWAMAGLDVATSYFGRRLGARRAKAALLPAGKGEHADGDDGDGYEGQGWTDGEEVDNEHHAEQRCNKGDQGPEQDAEGGTGEHPELQAA